jgi:hydrogenase-4 component F
VKRFLMAAQYRRMLRFEAETLRRFEAVLAVSDADRETFGRLYPGAARQPIHVVPTGVDTTFFAPSSDDPDVASPAAGRTLIVIGLFSMACAALFLLGTRNYKRMLAYSSVEHMGILSLAASLGPLGTAAALFHVWSNALTKGAIFLAAGNLHRAAGSAETATTRGLARLLPISSGILVTGMFAVTACPPFGPFFSELAVLRAVFQADHPVIAAVFLFCLLLAFLGLSRVVFGVVDGRPPDAVRRHAANFRETRSLLLPPLLLLALSLLIGLFTPGVLSDAWARAVHELFPVP